MTTRLAITACLAAVLTAAGLSAPAGPAVAGGQRSAEVTLTESALQGVHGTAADATVRNVLTVTARGENLRVRLSNPFGATGVTVRAASVGRQARVDDPALLPGSLRAVTFAGARSVTIAPGASVWSDPVRLHVRAGDHLAVSVYAPGAPVNDHTFPPPETDTPGSFLSVGSGDATRDQTGQAFGAFRGGTLWWVDAVAARSPARGTIVALGDSITDGYQAVGGGPRWTDVLAQRIDALPPARQLSVANAGISGNTVSVQPNPYDPTNQCCGPPAPLRLDRDVLSLPGVEYVILLEGTNDIGGGAYAPSAPPEQVIAAMREVAARVHAAGHKIVGATILPMCNPAGSGKERTRVTVNRWIRTSGAFDAVLDFDALLKDPTDPTVIYGPWRHDCYHPNAAGDAVLGRSIPLDVFGLEETRTAA
ncbi:GDSL-type esterase/lipase family protein [Micromonospora sp. 4G57]|uniref:GDSL-type esterase/lipase family protein n=1 Tax=Micromonospora sicca TaxID=2202420 RepID=A0ABU5J6D3_9ACTN|nr:MULTISPECIES: GDSL-type esterase/lipase family protein [unclassified Micromonospora]MDZ5443360.1 GDSL-type esterase/lipase family protein [Micromonospora sp. 4G57]MDZ5488140.1 GDSL-type esterase/lipase family protein [Micromonospora sp. 4G53]